MVFSEPIVGKISQRWQWLMARRINNPDGGFAGLVYGSIFVDTFSGFFNSAQLAPRSVIALRDDQYRLISRTTFDQSPPLPIGEVRMSEGMRLALDKDARGGLFRSGSSAPDGVDRLIAFRKNEKYGFTLLVGIPVDQVYASWIRQSAVIGVIATLLIIGVFLYARRARQHWASLLHLSMAQARESERLLLKQLIANIPCLLWLKDANGVYLAANREFERFFGHPVSDIVGRSDYDFVRRELAESFRAHDRAAVEAQEAVVNEEWITYADDGHRALLQTTKTPLRNPDGSLLGVLGIAFDITEARYTRDQLDEAMLFLSESQSMARVGGWKVNPETGYLMWTQEVYHLVEHPEDEPIDLQSGLTYYSPEDQPVVAALFETAWRDNTPFLRECRMIARSGRIFWAELRCVGRVVHENGDYLAGTFQDVTERKRAAAALNDERRVRETIMESIPGIFYALDRAGRFTFWNRNFERVTERSAAELSGMSAMEIFSPEEGAMIAERIRQVFEAGEATAEASLITKSGKPLPYFFTGRRIKMNGVPVLVGAGVDNSAQRQAEQALRDLNAELESRVERRSAELREANSRLLDTQFAMEEVGIGITWVDFASGRFVYANRYAAEILGYTVEEYLQLRVPDIDPNFPDAQFATVCQRIREIGRLTMETEQLTRDGRRVPMEVSIYYHAGRDDVAPRMIVFQTEIGMRKEIEGTLRQAKEAAEAASRAKSAFVANMSHEIRTPLNAILGLNHLMRAESLTARQMERLRKMDLAGRHLLGIINDILDLSKVEAGGLALEQVDFPLSSVLDGVAEMVREPAVAKGICLVVERGDAPEWLHGDATRLRQSLLNYASNAVKFTERGSVTLRARVVSERDALLKLRFEVVDTGIGLTQEQQARIFRAFEQADNSTARKYGGTGLGLALTKRLIELMGGVVGLASDYGRGSTFWFEVPLPRGKVRDTDAESGTESHVRRHFEGARVLLAEDNPINVEVVCEMLSVAGITVGVATTGAEAVEQCRASRFDLVLMDMQMPEMDGLEATQAIRANPAFAELPIVALTANAFAEDRRACLDAGMNEVLTKPIEPASLYVALDRWLPRAYGAMTETARQPEVALEPGVLSPAAMIGRLRHLAGVDVDQGLRVVRGALDRYLFLLGRFVDGHGTDAHKLEGFLSSGNVDAAIHLMHALKGASGMIGFRRVMEIAGSTETLLRLRDEQVPDDERLSRLASDLSLALGELVALVHTRPAEVEVPCMAGNPAAARAVIDQLARMLAEHDMKAQSYFEVNRAVVRSYLGEAYGSFAADMDRYAFEPALDAINNTVTRGGN